MESACGEILRLCLYTNKVVPRIKLRPDMGGKYQAVYFQIMDLPDWVRARAPLRWFTFGYVSVAQMDDAGVGVGQLMRAVLSSWFGAFWNIITTGIRLQNGGQTLHVFAKYTCSPQDERAHKFGFDLKGSSGSNPCASCDNCMGRVPYFEDDSGFAHVTSPMYHKFRPRSRTSAIGALDHIANAASDKPPKEFEAIQQAVGFTYNKDGLLWDLSLRAHIDFPDCVYWDWMHNWCSSGGIGQYHLNGFVQEISTSLNMKLEELDEFASKVRLPKSSPRLPRHYFRDRIVSGQGLHIRAFAAEVLGAVHVLAMFVQLVLKPVGILQEHVECFEYMQTLFALFKRADVNDVPKAYDLTQKHHRVFMALYDVAKPKLHYCMHVIDCWRRHGKLLSCFGAESNHRFSTDVFSFSYRKPCTTALAFDLRRLFQAVCEPRTYQETQLAGTIASWNDYSTVDMGPRELQQSSAALRNWLGLSADTSRETCCNGHLVAGQGSVLQNASWKSMWAIANVALRFLKSWVTSRAECGARCTHRSCAHHCSLLPFHLFRKTTSFGQFMSPCERNRCMHVDKGVLQGVITSDV